MHIVNKLQQLILPIVRLGPSVTLLGSVLELATILIEYVAPAVSPLITVLLLVFPANTDILSPPSIFW